SVLHSVLLRRHSMRHGTSLAVQGGMGTLQRFHPRVLRGDGVTLSPRERRLVIGVLAALGFVVVAALSLGGYFLGPAPRSPRPPYRQPSRLYGRSTQLAVGATYAPAELVAALAEEGYREAAEGDARRA